jgi:hypothetical protein
MVDKHRVLSNLEPLNQLKMSNRIRKQQIRQIRNRYPNITLGDLYDNRILPNNYHLNYEQNLIGGISVPQHKSDWWKRMKEDSPIQ